jgi:hypothetical protein
MRQAGTGWGTCGKLPGGQEAHDNRQGRGGPWRLSRSGLKCGPGRIELGGVRISGVRSWRGDARDGESGSPGSAAGMGPSQVRRGTGWGTPAILVPGGQWRIPAGALGAPGGSQRMREIRGMRGRRSRPRLPKAGLSVEARAGVQVPTSVCCTSSSSPHRRPRRPRRRHSRPCGYAATLCRRGARSGGAGRPSCGRRPRGRRMGAGRSRAREARPGAG